MKLNPIDCPVDIAFKGWDNCTPRLPVEEIQGLHDTGLSTDENGETLFDIDDPEIPWGWRVIEADDMSLFLPEEIA